MASPEAHLATSIAEIDSADWDGLEHGPSPFLRHGFLRALEESGSVGVGSGWQPIYVTLRYQGVLVAATAAFIKTDSYGEYIFDWAWARAAQQAGIAYYPKFVIAAPFTPASGVRFLIKKGVDERAMIEMLMSVCTDLAKEASCSSMHVLFCTEYEQQVLADLDFSSRLSFQFHWKNRGYAQYSDFLGALRSRKRKQLKKERSRSQSAVDAIVTTGGRDMSPSDLRALDGFYRHTVAAHGGFDYLRPGFFECAQRLIPDAMTWISARKNNETVAGAIFFETAKGLYGRYWGASQFVEELHFEMAYHQGIELCIAKGIPIFEAGAQGEHKLLRGFEPSPTFSAHKIFHDGFRRAVDGFLAEERHSVAARMDSLAEYGPYKEQKVAPE